MIHNRPMRNGWVSRRHRGQVLIMALLALLLLGGMVFYTYNLGDQVNRRVSVQNAADAAAISGTTEMARCMNLVAMNNVTQSRLIAMAAILDSLPLATELTYNELNQLATGLGGQIQLMQAGMNDPTDPNHRSYCFLIPGIQKIFTRYQGEVNLLAPMYQALVASGFDVRQLTYWRAPGYTGTAVPSGTLWRGAVELEALNAAVIDASGVLAQMNAAANANAAIARDAARVSPTDGWAGFIAPVLPTMPVRRDANGNNTATFLDFKYPVMFGRPVERSPELLYMDPNDNYKIKKGTTNPLYRPPGDEIYRGPYDQLFHWRYPDYSGSPGTPAVTIPGQIIGYNPPTSSGGQNPQGQPGLSPGPPSGSPGGAIYGPSVVLQPAVPPQQTGWDPYGIFTWALFDTGGWTDSEGTWHKRPDSGLAQYCGERSGDGGHLRDLPRNLIPNSNFITRMRILSKTKLDRFWGDIPPQTSIRRPHWVVPYSAALEIAKNDLPSIKSTMFWIVRIRSSVPPTDGANYLTAPGTFYDKDQEMAPDSKEPTPLTGWVDPEDPVNYTPTYNPDGTIKTHGKFGDTAPLRLGTTDIWQADWTYEVEFDEKIGLPKPPPVVVPPGMPPPPPVLHTVYVRDWFVFLGADDGGEDAIRNPGNWLAGDPLPRPWLMDLDRCDYRTAGERNYLSYLGIARLTNRPGIWAGRFTDDDPNPFPHALAVAEGHIFNNMSWDLWTQDWQARLRPIPVPQWSNWVNQRMYAEPYEFGAVSAYVRQDDVEHIRTILQGYDQAAVEILLRR